MRTVSIKYTANVHSENAVRFEGETFGDLQNRLIEARVPGVTSKTYIEVFVPNEGYVCLLRDEALPLDKRLEVYVTVEQPHSASQGVPVEAEPVTGQPVLPSDGVQYQGQGATASDLDWRVARKRDKLNRKLAKITAKLENLSSKHLGKSAKSAAPAAGGASHGHDAQSHRHHGCGGWGHRHPALRVAQALQGHGYAHVPHGYPPVAAGLTSGKDPSGANCPAEVVKNGKA